MQENDKSKPSGRKKVKLFKPRQKKSVEEEAAIKFLQAQYDKIVPDEIKTFKDLPLSQKTLKGLKENHYKTPTEIQRQAIGYALQGKDILGAAKTGSGKTLAFLIPVIEKLFSMKWTRLDGVGALVISPTRELAYQIYETLRKIGHYHDFSAGLIIGGQNLKFERKRMDQINILICTPGRLLQHMDENPLFNCDNLQILVLDEADRCLDMGFAETMNAIIENLPSVRQTLLFSATQTKSVKDLARLSLSFPTYVAPHEQALTITPDTLQQSYIVCSAGEKIGILWSFIKNHLKQKVLVFMATCKQVKYIYDLFCKLRPGVSVLALYGTLHQEKREKIYKDFCRKSNVVLLATDLASRGLDFPHVNWVIQFDCPEDVETYIHRAGRTARGISGKGEGLLMLMPHEEKIVEDLKKNKIPINKIAVDPSKVIAPQRKIETLLSEVPGLKESAQRAFVSYVKSIYLMKNKEIFNLEHIDTDAYSKSLGLVSSPTIKLLQKLKYRNANKKNESNEDKVIEKLQKNHEEESDESDNDDLNVKTAKINSKEMVKSTEKKKKTLKLGFHESDNSCDEDWLEVKRQEQKAEESVKSGKKKQEVVKLYFPESDDEDWIGVKRKHNIDDLTKSEKEMLTTSEITTLDSKKPLTKAAIAKKLAKRKVKVNTKVVFTEEGEAISDGKIGFKSELAKDYESGSIGGIDIESAVQLLQEEDKYDRMRFKEKIQAKHKESKRKLKNKTKEEGEKDEFGTESESDGADLSWLPDPDKVYNKNITSAEEDESGEDMSPDEEQVHRPPKRKLLTNKGMLQEKSKSKPLKKRKVEEISASLTVNEAEHLAMQLLKSK